MFQVPKEVYCSGVQSMPQEDSCPFSNMKTSDTFLGSSFDDPPTRSIMFDSNRRNDATLSSIPVFSEWWRSASIYQLLVPSFKDTTGSGMGDLRGIIEKMWYLEALGVDAIWLSPICKTPFYDLGYDISDFQGLNPKFGTWDDFHKLVQTAHDRGIKVIMDMAYNHTSVEHHWFTESRSSRDNPKHDWYFWKDPKINSVTGERELPNNWESVFEGPAWEYEPQRDQYYLHIFGDQQPDLNWDNPHVRNAVYESLRFWLDKGIDGFRLDCINLISKYPGLPDIWPPTEKPGYPYQPANRYFANGMRVHEYIREMHEKVFADYPEAMVVGEMSCGIELEQAIEFVRTSNKELNLAFHFHHMDLDGTDGDKWNLRVWTLKFLKNVIKKWQVGMLDNEGWNALYLENHDQPRCLVRFGHALINDSQLRAHTAKMIATWLFTLQGTCFILQGQELGMIHPPPWQIHKYADVETKRYYELCMEWLEGKCMPAISSALAYLERGDVYYGLTGDGIADSFVSVLGNEFKYGWHGLAPSLDEKHYSPSLQEEAKKKLARVMRSIHVKGRDNVRVPIPWNSSTNGGFTTNPEPWLQLTPDYPDWNVTKEVGDPGSVWSYYRKMIRFRKEHPVLVSGYFYLIDEENEEIFAYIRTPRKVTLRKQRTSIDFTDLTNNIALNWSRNNSENSTSSHSTSSGLFSEEASSSPPTPLSLEENPMSEYFPNMHFHCQEEVNAGKEHAYLIILNFREKNVTWHIPIRCAAGDEVETDVDYILSSGYLDLNTRSLVISNYDQPKSTCTLSGGEELEECMSVQLHHATMELKPYEARVYMLDVNERFCL